jgi:imidazolonepropionase-like amidohydrolase
MPGMLRRLMVCSGTALLVAVPALATAQDLRLSLHATASGALRDPQSYAITNVTVIPMDKERVLAAYTVFVDDGLITAMGPSRELRVPASVEEIDGTGKFLIPGLTEMHIHLGQGTGETANEGLGRQLRLALAHGVTTMRGVIAPPGILAVRDRICRGEVLGPTLYVAGPSLNGQSVPDPETGRALVRTAKAKGYDFLKTHGGMSAESYEAIATEAKAQGLPLAGHVTPSYGLERAMRFGQQVEHLDGYIAAALPDGVPRPHGQIIDDDVAGKVDWTKVRRLAEETKRLGIWNGLTLALFQVIAGGEPASEHAARPEMKYVPHQALAQWTGYLNNGPGRLPRFLAVRDSFAVALYRAGARLLVSADAPQIFLVTGFGTHQEMQAMARAGIPPYAVLEAATRNAAEYLGRHDAGVIAVGKRADLVLLDRNPLKDIANAAAIRGVMVHGRWLDRAALDAMLAEVESAVR